MKDSFKYTHNKKVIRGTVIFLLLLLVTVYVYYRLSGNIYLAAWVLGVAGALTLFATMSIPRKINVSASMLEIQCLIELTQIPLEDVASISTIDRREFKWAVPLVASCGFFGYFGYYLDLRKWNTFKVYVTSWENLVVIQDVNEDLYVVNCPQRDELIALVTDRCNQIAASNNSDHEEDYELSED